MNINLLSNESTEKLTARLFWQPVGKSYHLDLGNVVDYKYTPDNQYRTHMGSARGYRIVDDEQVDSTDQKWEFTLDQMAPELEKLVRLATRGADTTQIATAHTTANFEAVSPPCRLQLNRRPVYDVTVQVSSTVMTEGTDYEVDYDSGAINILEGGAIEEGDDIGCSFGVRARTYQNFTGRDAVNFPGTFRIEEYNQFSKEPLRVITFSGLIRISAWPEQTGDFGKCTAVVRAKSQPAIVKRYEAVLVEDDGEGS